MSPGTDAAKALGTPVPEILLNGFDNDPSAFGPADLSTKIVLPIKSIAVKPLDNCTNRSPLSVKRAPLTDAITPSSDRELIAFAKALAKSAAVLSEL